MVKNVYENTKKVKIQWLEEQTENVYKLAYIDWIEPLTIISTVSVKKLEENKMFSVDAEDLTRIKALLDQAIKNGGIVLDESSSSSDEEESDESKSEDEEKQKKRKNSEDIQKSKAKIRKTSPSKDTSDAGVMLKLDTDPYTFDDDRSSGSSIIVSKKKIKSNKLPKADENETTVEPVKNVDVSSSPAIDVKPKISSSSITITPTPSVSNKTHLQNIREKVIANIKKHEQNTKQQPSSTSSKSPSAVISQSLSSIATNKIKQELMNKKPILKKAKKAENNDKGSESGTDKYSESSSELVSDDSSDFVKKKPKQQADQSQTKKSNTTPTSNKLATNGTSNKASNGTPKQIPGAATTKVKTNNGTPNKPAESSPKKFKTPTTTAPNSNSKTTTAKTSPAAEKKKLLKAISNRFLEENEKINVLAKDPFFEDSTEASYISAEVQSKLAFRAIYLDDMVLLKKLIEDKDKVSSLNCRKSVYNKLTPLHYAIKLGRREAVELLIDEYLSEKVRVQMPKAMLSKFTTGNWNKNTFNAHYVRPLAQSRGCKEGNNAFLKDVNVDNSDFVEDLIDFCFENDCSIEIFDLISQRFANNFQKLCLNSINRAVLRGNRKLASYALDKCQSMLNSEGFNSLHVSVLSFENNEELKTQQLRTQTCLKKAFMNDSVSPLHFSCINTNAKYLKTLVNTTQEANFADKRGRKLIHYAAVCEGTAPLEYLLLVRHISQYECDSMGNTPLHYACIAGRSANIELLLRHAKQKHEDNLNVCTDDDIFKFDTKFGLGGINKPNRQGKNALHLAVENGNYEAVRILLKHGCNIDYPMSNSFNKITALMYAVQLGFFKIVQMLHENGARIESRDRLMRTPTIHASMCGSAHILSYLLRQGTNANAFDSSGNTCIHYACAYGFYFCVSILIEAGAECNPFNDWKLTPFGISFLKGHVGVCELLLTTNKIDINFRTENGETLIMLVVSNSLNKLTLDQITYMIKKLNANCNLADSSGNNALHYLARNTSSNKEDEKMYESYRQQIAALLIANKCLVNSDNNQFETPLFLAIKENNIQFAKYLLLNHANSIFEDDVIKKDMNGKTLLHLICEFSLPSNAFELILDDESTNDFLLLKYIHKFKQMANMEDDKQRLPIHLAFISLKQFLVTGGQSKSEIDIPRNFYKFIELLYYSLGSNINKPINIYKTEFHLLNDVSNENSQVTIPPLFLLLNDSCCNLIEFMAKISETHIDANLKIDYNAADNDDCSMIHKSIVNKQHSLCKLLISLGCFNLEKKILTNNLEKKSLYLHENLLHICIRFKLFDIFDMLIQQLFESNDNFLVLIQQANINGQNILHLICSLLSQTERVAFGVERLEKLFEFIAKKGGEENEDVKSSFLNKKDNQQRTPLHLCLFMRESSGNMDLELFLIENGSHMFATDDQKRIPLHYLFCNQLIDESFAKQKFEITPEPEKVDPIELLTLITKNMDLKNQIDTSFSDDYGMTPLHYAAMRGSTICCLHIIENSNSSPHHLLFKPCLRGNSPLSLAIFYKSDTCLLTLLKQISGNNDDKFSLKSFYHLSGENDNGMEIGEKDYICWAPKTVTINAFPLVKQTLYELILNNRWEGISWLILENLEKYGLTRLDTIFYAIKANNYSLALRLIEKYEKYATNKVEFYDELHSEQEHESKRTLLHILCLKSASINQKNELILIKILNKLLSNATTSSFYSAKDSFNCSAMHYACYKHNFLIIDHFFKSILEIAKQLLIAKDGLEQTAFSLLFWSIGRVTFTAEIKSKILNYYKIMSTTSADSKIFHENIKAFYNLIETNNFGYINDEDSPDFDDYPNEVAVNRSKQILNPLLFAINRQDIDMCIYLVRELNFDVNSFDANHIPAIVYAIRVNNIDFVRVLLSTDYSLESKKDLNKTAKCNENKTVVARKALFNIFNNNSKEEGEEEDEEEDDEEASDDEASNEKLTVQQPDTLNPTKFQIQTNINLFYLDSESRSIFHNLACTLDYGSYSNLNICKLLLYSKKKFEASTIQNALQIEQQQNYFNEELRQIIKHLDKKSNSAIDYAIKYGNYELADELKKFLSREQAPQASVKLPAFYVHDPHYAGPNAIHDYKYDSDELLRSFKTTETDIKNFEVKVDVNSQMEKTGVVYWDTESNQPYDCMLTKTDIMYGIAGMHNFYKFQLIKQKFSHANNKDTELSNLYVLFTRWGRIGTTGQYQRTPFTNLDEAKLEFRKIFRQKTGNDFTEVVLKKVKKFELKPKKYNLITFEMRKMNKISDFNFDLPTSSLLKLEHAVITGETVECKIKNAEYIKFFLDLCDSKYLKETSTKVTDIAYDYIPLTRLSRQILENAFYLLTNDIKTLIDERMKFEKKIVQNKNKDTLNDYASLIENINLKSNEYYQLIPQFDYEFEKLKPIDDYNEYEKQLGLILQLIDYQYSIKILMGAFNSLKTINPIDYIYNTINCKLQFMSESEAETQYILRYIWSSTKNSESKEFNVERIFKFEYLGGGGDEELASIKSSPVKNVANKNRVLLWHGTGAENMLSIMSKGLVKCPPLSRKTGARYGKGIYTSDVFTMSASYSRGKIFTPDKETHGYESKYMLLCEVTLGNIYEVGNYESVDHAPEGYDSVKATGQLEPNEQYTIQLPNGAKLPLGGLIDSQLNESNLVKKINKRTYNQYNQYIVYDETQVCVRYIVQFRQAF